MLVALGIVAAVVLLAGSGDDSPDRKTPAESNTARTPTPSLSVPSELPTRIPTEVPSPPSDFPSDIESLLPSAVGDDVPYYMLSAGDCFDADDARPGQAAKRSCRRPHDAEVVKVAELNGTYATDAALKKAATELCDEPLAAKAKKQPAGSVRGTLVQYPDTTGYKLGIDKVACSLAADDGTGDRKLTKPLV
ncbi:hypothetical protein [Streptomyces himalayensis]|uniref:Septum formation-related domain-containing protein n=1 Tax=Streptomyces himalayensis subsp. himalayensis TaxID=2756131 RepID=A0A7W0DIP1_9ACTN|nr:hypothetical protein [Streptomyces himalayensis]MBA2945824.1 hypothetical protein [Streptomyces himalayensis subsp. himalayensis]